MGSDERSVDLELDEHAADEVQGGGTAKAGTSSSAGQPTESVSLNFGSIKQTYEQ